MKKSIIAAAVCTIVLLSAGTTSVNAAGFGVYVGNSGYGYPTYYTPTYSTPVYSTYPGYVVKYNNSNWVDPDHTWHDTSHWDYRPARLQQHGNHFHYVPSRYEWHETGHVDHHHW